MTVSKFVSHNEGIVVTDVAGHLLLRKWFGEHGYGEARWKGTLLKDGARPDLLFAVGRSNEFQRGLGRRCGFHLQATRHRWSVTPPMGMRSALNLFAPGEPEMELTYSLALAFEEGPLFEGGKGRKVQIAHITLRRWSEDESGTPRLSADCMSADEVKANVDRLKRELDAIAEQAVRRFNPDNVLN